jgi:osmotically inducible protein OsmC
MPVRTAEAEWNGNLQQGNGTMQVGSGAYNGAYSVGSRFQEAAGSNPEELIAAAHAGCFSMALAAGLTRAGHAPTRIHTTAKVHVEQQGGGFAITRIELDTQGQVPGIDNAAFQEQAQQAKQNCPVSKALAAVPDITLNARLV